MKLPLRERKKLETRRSIVESANRLFKAQGFAGTTLDQIGEKANIHKITVLRYFPSKEAIAFSYHEDLFAEFQEELAARRGSVIDCWRAYIHRTSSIATRLHRLVERWEFVNSDSDLVAYQLGLDLRYQIVLSRAFSEEADRDPDTDVFSTAVAALLVAGNSRVAHLALRSGAYDGLQDACLAVVDIADGMLRDAAKK